MKTLQNTKRQNGYRACEVTFSRVEFNEACGINYPRSKSHFSPWMKKKKKKKTRFLKGYYGVQKFDRVVLPRVIPRLRRLCHSEEIISSDGKATLVARY